jgi:membrane protein
MVAIWKILKQAVSGYLAHDALSRGAAIAFYVVTSLAPVLLIVVAIAGAVFGADAVRGSLVNELSGVFGQQGGELIQTMLARSSDKSSSAVVSIFGALMVIVTTSGVFSEMQTGLNRAWDVKPTDQPWLSLVRTRAASLALVAALGFLLMVSLAASTGLAALGNYLGARSAFAPLLLSILNTVVSIALFTVLFAAIFKVLPDTAIGWRDVIIGAFVTAVLFTIGKSLIGWYLGTTAASSGYGAAGALNSFFSGPIIPRRSCCLAPNSRVPWPCLSPTTNKEKRWSRNPPPPRCSPMARTPGSRTGSSGIFESEMLQTGCVAIQCWIDSPAWPDLRPACQHQGDPVQELLSEISDGWTRANGQFHDWCGRLGEIHELRYMHCRWFRPSTRGSSRTRHLPDP